MTDKFPILEVTKASLLMPLQYSMDILKALGIVILAAFIGGVVMALLMFLIGFDPAAMEQLPAAMQSGDMSGIGGLGGFLLGYLGLIFVVIAAFAHIFNYWVRLAAFGKEDAKVGSFKQAAAAAAVNGLKFILLAILLGIIAVVVYFLLESFGASRGFFEIMAMSDPIEQAKVNFTGSLINAVIACFVYSLFSANLTQTAIGDENEPLKHAHSVDFAVTLMLIYSIVIFPTILAALSGSTALLMAVQVVTGVFVIFAVPAAHGLRYRICAAENVQQIFSDDSDKG